MSHNLSEIMIMCNNMSLLTEWESYMENIWLWVTPDGPSSVRYIQDNRRPNIFQVKPHLTQSIST